MSKSCPLAIVGMSCLFPKADDLQAYWANIKNGVDAITPVPAGSHWSAADYFDADPKSPDHTYAQRGGFLSQVNFNPMEFGIAPKDIEATDTSQLLSLIAAQKALADAGYNAGGSSTTGGSASPGRSFDRDRTSVILGVTGALELVIPLGARLGHPHWRKALKDAGVAGDIAEDVVQRISDSYVGWQENSFPGLLGNVTAGRIANRLDLGGTNCVVDAACASSLAAIHLAGLELAAGLSDMVITGGVDTFNDIFMYMCFSKTPALSPTGDAKPFDASCDGTVLGEGLGMLVLKRLADAERDGDRIYAVLKGMGSSSDGRSSAIYAPRAGGQKVALQRAYAAAGVTPDTLDLIEAHGTGTKVGDATELSGLTEVFQAGASGGTAGGTQNSAAWCALGSVKSQIGHTKAAAGVAGVIKAAMALHQKILPPTIKVTQPLEGAAAVDAKPSPFYVNTQKRPWLPSTAHPRRAGVSALGFGGTNFHAVLEEHGSSKLTPDWDGDVEILALCSGRFDDLKAQLTAHQSASSASSASSWLDFRRAAHASRAQFQSDAGFRLLIVVTAQSDRRALMDAALKMLEKNPEKTAWTAPSGIAFGAGKVRGKLGALFPGQGSQYVGMLRDLACQFPDMLNALAEANAVFASESSAVSVARAAAAPGALRLSDVIYPHPAFSEATRQEQEEALKATNIAQPALGAVSQGALHLLNYFGVTPQAASGHSYGELSALCAAGRISLAALHQLSNVRGRLMANQSGSASRGAMLAVQADEATVQNFLREENSGLVIANRNAPKQFVLAGTVEQIQRAAEALTRRSIRSRVLPVSAAFHSTLVADARMPFAAALEPVKFGKSAMPVYANTTGAEYPKAEKDARELLADQIVHPVNFMQQIEAMHAAGVSTFVEVGPSHVLSDLVQSILPGAVEAVALDASKGARSGIFDLAFALGRLASLGHPVDLSKWENAPAPAEAAGKKALTVPITGANYRAPQTARPPAAAKPVIAAAPAPASLVVALPAAAPVLTPAYPQAPASAPPVSQITRAVAPAAVPLPAADIPAALRAAQEGILALQRLQEQTAQLHQQFLEGQESARRAIQSLLSLRMGAPMQVTEQAAATATFAPAAAPPVATFAPARPIAPAAAQPAVVQSVQTAGRALYEQTVLDVVSDKTGYPVEMLTLDMGMDADLGIDSIKRVEIMAALRGKLPQAPEIKPEHLGLLQTLEQVVAFLAAGAGAGPAVLAATPAAAVAPAAPAEVRASGTPGTSITTVLLDVVSDKTGYPVEMLDLGMGLDADLGIDSIKRVEIMAALRAKLPGAPEIKPEHLGSLQTLQQIADFLGASNESAAVSAAAPLAATATAASIASTPAAATLGSTAGTGRISQILLAVAADKTGYPVEMLNLDMGLDADLGIDSIKRVEIMAALRAQLPGSPEIKPEHLGSLQTLQQMADFLAEPSAAPVPVLHTAPVVAAVLAPLASAHEQATPAQPLSVMRQVVRTVEMSAGERRDLLTLPAGAQAWLLDDGSALAQQIAARLESRHLTVQRLRLDGKFTGAGAAKRAAAPSALIVLAPAAPCDDSFLKRAFRLIQQAGPGLRKAGAAGGAMLVTVSRLDGAFGFGAMGAHADPVSGGLAGMVKTARLEWPEVQCKAIDLDPATLQAEQAAAQIVEEMFLAGPVEVGLSGTVRVVLEVDFEANVEANVEANAATVTKTSLPLRQADVVVISGGARGVTGDAALALARTFRSTLVLLGRSELPDAEPVWAQGLATEAELKKALFAILPRGTTPAAVEASYRQLLAQREIRTQLAQIEAAGARAVYCSVDVRDAAAVTHVLADVRSRHGAISGLVHGAGVLADRRIEDKTEEQFDAVYGTKVTGLRNLLAALAQDELKVIALFSSYTGRFGRIGQIDYAAANEVLNKLAQQEARRDTRRRANCRVVSINWGPWNGGMVTPGLRKLFEQEGVGLIDTAAGAAFLVREMCAPASAAVEVLALAPPPQALAPKPPVPPTEAALARSRLALSQTAVAFEREVSVAALPFLASHVINGRAVLPAALMVEWLAQAALHGHPGMRFHGLDDFKVLKGVVLDAGQSVTVRLHAGAAQQRDKLHVVPVYMTSLISGAGAAAGGVSGDAANSRQILHAQADVLLTEEKLPNAPVADVVDMSGGAIADAYSLGVLFHGAALHGIERVEVCAERGVAALLKAASAPIKWMQNPLRGSWIADPLALDSAFQMMILWSNVHRGGPSLPSALRSYRQFVSAFPKGGCRAVIGVALGISAIAVATIQFLDRQGNVLASAEGCEFVVDAKLHDAFRLNRLQLDT